VIADDDLIADIKLKKWMRAQSQEERKASAGGKKISEILFY
jgi:hypothetical protein